MFRRLFGGDDGGDETGELVPVSLTGGFEVEVVGESNYQDALSSICGGPAKEGHDHECTATLRAEASNPYDPNAIRIEIDGHLVGYLNRQAAKFFKPTADRLASQGQVGTCAARIVGGWDRGEGDIGSFGVRLDLGVQ
jgi:hypothetical protein